MINADDYLEKNPDEIEVTWQNYMPDGQKIEPDKDPIARALNGVTTHNLEHRCVRRDGTSKWGLASAAPIYDSSGNQIAVLLVMQDITERKETEKNLQISDLRLNMVGKASGVVVWDWNIITNELRWSDNFFEIFGYTEIDTLPTLESWSNFIHPNDAEKTLIGLNNVVSSEDTSVWKDEYRFKKKNDSYAYTLDWGTVIRDDKGESVRMIGAMLDITERKRSERALKNNQNFLDSIIDQSPFATWISDEKGTIIKCNIALKKLLNITDEQLVGKYNVFEDEIAMEQGLTPKIRSVFEDGKTANFSVEWDAKDLGYKDANKVHIEGTMFPIHDDKGNLTNVVNHWIDVTKRTQAEKGKIQLEAQLQQAQKMEAIGTLAGGIAHDFNNILSAILGYAEMARDDCQPDTTVAKDLDKVLEGGNRAKDLVQQILAFSRQDEMERILLQPVSVVKESIKFLRPSLPTTIEINQDIAFATGMVLADPTQIHQILMNLCTNAFHAMEETGGKLDISLKEVTLSTYDLVHEPNIESGTFVQLSICDSGPGITSDIKAKIFDPYFTTKEAGKGTGMGLSIVHGIVQSYGGFISLCSEPGEGATFHVFLPVIEKELLPEVEDVEPIPVGKEKILYIDDEEILAEMGKSMLERLGYHVTVRNNSIEALETFQNQPDQFDLVITDQTMPGMTGADIARRMMQIRPDIPIILCTGYSTTISEEKAKSMGIKEFAVKPLSKKDIAVLIRKVLDNY